jgi:hypothetical protein
MNPDRRIEELEQELGMLEVVEERARARLLGKDDEWNAKRDHMIEKMCGLISSFKIEDPPHKAVHILGQILSDAQELAAPRKLIDTIDNKRKVYHALLAEREAANEVRRAARADMMDARRA